MSVTARLYATTSGIAMYPVDNKQKQQQCQHKAERENMEAEINLVETQSTRSYAVLKSSKII